MFIEHCAEFLSLPTPTTPGIYHYLPPPTLFERDCKGKMKGGIETET